MSCPLKFIRLLNSNLCWNEHRADRCGEEREEEEKEEEEEKKEEKEENKKGGVVVRWLIYVFLSSHLFSDS